VRIGTIDAHAEGGPLRLIVDGFPTPRGKTMHDKMQWAERHAGHLRRALMYEPRGHADLHGAVLTAPVAPGSHAGVLFMHGGGYTALSGHGLIAVATIVLERRLLVPAGAEHGESTVVFDTVAGTVRARAAWRDGRVAAISYKNVASFVLRAGVTAEMNGRPLRVDVAFGGVFYAIADGEAAGLGIEGKHLPELRRAGQRLTAAVESTLSVVHPVHGNIRGVAGAIFTGPAGDGGAHLRSASVLANGAVDRSPSGTGSAAVMAVLDAMGLLGEGMVFVHEGLAGTKFTGRVAGRTAVGEFEAIVPEITGSAWITGEHAFLIDPSDPFPEGFRFG
jgi:proline racemase